MYKTFIVGVLMLFSWVPAMAYGVFVAEVENPYDIISLSPNIEESQVQLGALEGFSIMYEVTLEATSTISARLRQEYNPDADPALFGLMMVRQSDRGNVYEVARYNPTAQDWMQSKEASLGLDLLSSEKISEEVGPGLYRIEVSTPDNQGSYMLELGQGEMSGGYFASVGYTRTIQNFFGYSPLKMFTASLIYYPIGIILLLFAIYMTWRYRKTIPDAS